MMSTRIRILLVVSLILNVFLVGIGIGVFVTGARIAPPQPPQQRRLAPNAWVAAETLPPVERIKFRQMLRDRALAVQPELKSVRLARREAVALMSQPNYDQNAVAAALQTAREGEEHVRGEIDAALIDYMAHLTPEQRTAMAEAMVRNRPNQLRAMTGQGGPGGPGQGASGAGEGPPPGPPKP